jgi:L-Lysine epsilon oxidase N-terminal
VNLPGADFGPVTLAGQFYGSKPDPTDVYLGEARTDETGRLIVLTGHGYSHSIADKDQPYPPIISDFDSADWIDDTSDGWISVTVEHKSGTKYAPLTFDILPGFKRESLLLASKLQSRLVS